MDVSFPFSRQQECALGEKKNGEKLGWDEQEEEEGRKERIHSGPTPFTCPPGSSHSLAFLFPLLANEHLLSAG